MPSRLCIVGLAAITAGACAAEELTVGRWTIVYDEGGVRSAAYGEARVLGHLSATLYTNDYKGSHWALTGAEVEHEQEGDAHRLIFTREVPNKAKGVGTFEISGDRLRWSLAMEMIAPGPLEVHVPIPKETVETPSGDLFFDIDGREHEVIYGHTWETLLPRSKARLKAEEFDIVLRPAPEEGRWLLQDRRKHDPSDVRIIGTARSSGEGVTRVTPAIEIEVAPLSAEAADARRLVRGQQRSSIIEPPVTIRGPPSPAVAQAKFEGRRLDVADGLLADSLGPLGRHIYEITW